MQPGVPALLVLLASLAAGGALGSLLSARRQLAPADHPLYILLVTQLVVASIFWGWAVDNCFTYGLDLGVISFAFAAVAAIIGLYKFERTALLDIQKQRWLIGLSGALVAANYLIGVVLTLGMVWTLVLYMAAGCAVWICATMAGVSLLSRKLSNVNTNSSLLDHGPRSETIS